MADSVFGPALTNVTDNLVPYLQPREFAGGDPAFSDMGHQDGDRGIDYTNSDWGYSVGTQPDKNYDTSDLSKFFGNQGVQTPDWNSFWNPGVKAQQIYDPATQGMIDDPNHPATPGSYDKAGATAAYNKYQSDIAGKLGLDANGHYMFSTSAQNPTSTDSTHDYVNALYKQNDDGRYNPIWANPSHRTSNWVDNRSDYLQMALAAATVASAGLSAPASGAGATNPALIDSFAQTPGYGASSAGLGEAGAGASSIGSTLGSGLNLAKQGYGLYNTAQSIQNGDLMGALGGGLSAYSGMGGDDPYGLARMAKGGIGAYGAVNSALNGNFLGAINGGINSGSNLMGGADKFGGTFNKDSKMPDLETGGYSTDPMQDGSGYSRLMTTGENNPQFSTPASPYAMQPNMSAALPLPEAPTQGGSPQQANPFMDGIRGGLKTAQSFLNPNVGGLKMNLGDMGAGLMGMYSGYKQKKAFGDMADQLKGMYTENSPYAQTLRHQLETKDAAAGRRSQYGPREVELQAHLADAATRSAPALAQMYQGQFGSMNNMINAGQRFAGATGVGGALSKWLSQPSGNLQGANPAADLGYRNGSDIASDGYADGGPVRYEPRVGTRSPVRTGGGGGMSPEAVRAALSPASAASSPNAYVDPMNPRSVNDYRERTQGLAGGGSVYGPGTSRSDSIPARLSNGEHVMDAHSVSALGGGDNALGQARLNALRAKLRGGR